MTGSVLQMSTNRNQAIARLLEYGRAVATMTAVEAHRDEWVWDAHLAGVSKAEISRMTGLSYATVDRSVRATADSLGIESAEEA
jgi:hypothetical protein